MNPTDVEPSGADAPPMKLSEAVARAARILSRTRRPTLAALLEAHTDPELARVLRAVAAGPDALRTLLAELGDDPLRSLLRALGNARALHAELAVELSLALLRAVEALVDAAQFTKCLAHQVHALRCTGPASEALLALADEKLPSARPEASPQADPGGLASWLASETLAAHLRLGAEPSELFARFDALRPSAVERRSAARLVAQAEDSGTHWATAVAAMWLCPQPEAKRRRKWFERAYREFPLAALDAAQQLELYLDALAADDRERETASERRRGSERAQKPLGGLPRSAVIKAFETLRELAAAGSLPTAPAELAAQTPSGPGPALLGRALLDGSLAAEFGAFLLRYHALGEAVAALLDEPTWRHERVQPLLVGLLGLVVDNLHEHSAAAASCLDALQPEPERYPEHARALRQALLTAARPEGAEGED